MTSLLQNIWWYLVLIGVMILIHELGHYWVARLFDVKVEVFSFGFGPRLFGFRRGDTDFRFSAILFGGYVKMTGEQPGDEAAADPRSFLAHPRWQRMCIAFAGPAINVVLAVVLLAGLYTFQFPKIPSPASPVLGEVTPTGAAYAGGVRVGDQVVQIDDVTNPNWEDITLKELASARHPLQVWVMRAGDRLHFTIIPEYEDRQGVGYAGWGQETEVQVAGFVPGIDSAERAGLKKGDVLVSVNGQGIKSTSRLHEVIDQTKSTPVELVYSHEGVEHQTSITPVRHDENGAERWMIGVALEPRLEFVKLPVGQALVESGRQNLQSGKLIFKFLKGIVERRMSPKSLEGPIRIAQISGQAAREGAVAYIGLMSVVSLNLAIFNLLPVPILDGGVILLLLVEMLLRRDLDLRVKEAVIKAGFVFLMMVVVFVLYNDISKILPPG